MMNDHDIEKLVKASIQTKIVEAFNETPGMIDKLVEAALNKEVDEHGGKPGYGARERMPYLEYLVGNEIRLAAHRAVQEYVESRKDEIAQKVVHAMQSAEFGSSIAEAVSNVLQGAYRWNFELNLERDKGR